MKKLLIVSILFLFTGIAFGQTIQKNGSFGIHVLTIELAEGVTMDQYMEFLTTKYIPEAEKLFKGNKIILMKGDRGKHINKIAYVNYFESTEARDRYYPQEGVRSDEANEIREKMAPLREELEKLGTISDEYSGFVIL
jgi:hypothetical protein